VFILVLSGHYDRDQGLDSYLLALVHGTRGHINQWRATSSQAHMQKLGSDYVRGGLIPPTYHCHGLKQYQVALNPLNMKHLKGVEGNFYPITPFKIQTKQGTERGDFGIHLDANSPGSLGCIVMDGVNFKDFEATMAILESREALDKIPLHVFYS
jgi:hypothetical protein